MAKPRVGDVVRVPFRFSDLSGSKDRPALVVADLPGEDMIICKISKTSTSAQPCRELPAKDLDGPAFPVPCFLHPLKIFTISAKKVSGYVTRVKQEILAWARDEIKKLFP